MNEDRMTAYANLIKEIKDSPIGQEWGILNQYPDLMDETLITIMKQAISVLAKRGERDAADRFVKLVIQLKDK